MFSLSEIKDKVAKEKSVEITSDSSNIYSDRPINFKIKITELYILNYISFKVYEHNKKNPDNKIKESDVVNAVIEKALLENALLYTYSKSYEDLVEESMYIRATNTQLHYFAKKTVPLSEENKILKAEVESVKEENLKQSKEIKELKSKLESIENVFK